LCTPSQRLRPASMMRREQGVALIDLLFVIGMILVLTVLAVPGMLRARQSATAASAIASMRAINSAQLTFALTCGGGFYAPNLSTLGTAPPGTLDGFIGGGLGASDIVTKGGYIVRLTSTPFAGAPASCNGLAMGGAGQAFVAAADPAEPSNPRFFATNANAQI